MLSGKRPLAPVPRGALKGLLARMLADHDAISAVSIVFVDDEQIRKLHRDFLGVDSATDVLTFPLDGPDATTGGELLGEVYVSVDTARREAKRRGLDLERELSLYAVHGVLHLLDYDDVDPGARRTMRRKERKYLGLM